MSEPYASVVIPVHDRPVALRNTLMSLTRQTLDRDAFDVVVVDDGSSAPLADHIDDLVDGNHVRVIRHERARGAAAARNTGAGAVAGRLLVFLDADCLCHPDLLRAHLATQRDRPIAACGFAGGRELTVATWRLILGDGWDLTDTEATFARLARTPALHDPLTDILAQSRPTDWAFFWTLNASVPKWAFDLVGGFDATFEVKGCEDMELGYRLARAGVPTVFAPEAVSLHQPHDRNRNLEVARDRRNEHILVRKHPNIEVEAVCSYDIVRSRELFPAIEQFAERLTADASDCVGLAELPNVAHRIATADSVLLVGSPAGWPSALRPPDAVCYPADVTSTGVARHLPLLGTRLPETAKRYALGMITDYWRHFPERTVSRILAELHRVCRDVLILSGASTKRAARPDPTLAEALFAHDHPYWEFTTPLRRELHQFRLVEWDRNGRGQAAFECTPTDWPTTNLETLPAP
jgi:glycosyltransferase involved in cell wall biosynthesis